MAFYTDANRNLISDAGGVAPLVALLGDGTDVQEYAAGLLWRLTDYNHNNFPIGQLGAIPALVALMRDGTDMQKENATLYSWGCFGTASTMRQPTRPMSSSI